MLLCMGLAPSFPLPDVYHLQYMYEMRLLAKKAGNDVVCMCVCSLVPRLISPGFYRLKYICKAQI